jgi:protein subunit release factor A
MANNMILERLEGVKLRFIEVGELLTQPDVLSDMERYIKLNREYKDLQPIIESYERYKLALSNITSSLIPVSPKWRRKLKCCSFLLILKMRKMPLWR